MSAPDGHLFLNPNEAEPDPEKKVLGPLQGVKNRLVEFARQFVPDPHVGPNHGWRHRFKTLWREAGLDSRIMDAIHGHSARTVGDEYGDVTVKAMASALAKFPRQDISSASEPIRNATRAGVVPGERWRDAWSPFPGVSCCAIAAQSSGRRIGSRCRK